MLPCCNKSQSGSGCKRCFRQLPLAQLQSYTSARIVRCLSSTPDSPFPELRSGEASPKHRLQHGFCVECTSRTKIATCRDALCVVRCRRRFGVKRTLLKSFLPGGLMLRRGFLILPALLAFASLAQAQV